MISNKDINKGQNRIAKHFGIDIFSNKRGIGIIQVDGLLFTNKRFLEIIGYSEEELKKMSLHIALTHIHPEDLKLFVDEVSYIIIQRVIHNIV